MKRSLVTLALVAVAGTAGAQTATTPSVGGSAVTTPPAAAPTMSTPAVPPQSMGASSAPAAAPPASMTAPNMAPNTANAPNAQSMPNAPGSAKALKKIEADGYKSVQGLTRNPDGTWSGKAMRGGSVVDVMVDARGNVVTR